jgi:NADPH:quinone reductase-like Zn-dependent oxidoreductase
LQQPSSPLTFTQDYDEIKVSDAPKPESKVGQVLVRISAVGISFVDLLYVSPFSGVNLV